MLLSAAGLGAEADEAEVAAVRALVAQIRLLDAAWQANHAAPVPKDAWPLPAGPDVYVWEDMKAESRAWRERYMWENYERFGVRDARWDDQVKDLIPKIAAHMSGYWEPRLSGEMRDRTRDLVASGCRDPWVMYLRGYALAKWSNTQEDAETFVAQSLDGLEKSKYPPLYKYHAARLLAKLQKKLKTGTKREREELVARAIKFFAAACGHELFTNEGQRFGAEELGAFESWLPIDQLERLVEEMRGTPGADPYLVGLAAGWLHIQRAWKVRGTGVAYTVTKEGWRQFGLELKAAREALTAAHTLHPELPYAANLMITVSMGSGGTPTPRQWFDRTVAAQFDYTNAYDQLLWALRPRWGGSHAQMYAFGFECLKTKRFDTQVPTKYIAAVWSIARELGGRRELFRQPEVYAHMSEFYEGQLAAARREKFRDYDRSMYAIVAWMAGDFEKADRLLSELGGAIRMAAAFYFEVNAERVAREIRANVAEVKARRVRELLAQSRSQAVLPPNCEGAFMIPTAAKDQFGNPVVTREGRALDSETRWPYEIWLKKPRMEFVLAPAGTFTMGGNLPNEQPRHEVTFAMPFYMAKYETTQGQWFSVMGTKPWSGQRAVREGARRPACYVTWEEWQGFTAKLQEATLGLAFRLPTEAEWEYACRAGSLTEFCYGDDPGGAKPYAWYDANTGKVGRYYAQPVGLTRPNAWGLYDMHGNVWEWCSDWFGPYAAEPQTDPIGPARGAKRVQRGGGFNGPAMRCRSANRIGNSPRRRHAALGARVVLEIP